MSMINSVTVVGGKDKDGAAEAVSMLEIKAGEIFAVVGTTGSGKSMLIADIEQWADGETPSQRHILINQVPAAEFAEDRLLRGMAAEVSQNMNFVMDMSVRGFLCLHARSRSLEQPEELAEQVINYANRLSGEAISGKDKLTVLSGGQSRALMVADVALISDAPVVLIDEIENAGIDRLAALKGLTLQDKIVVLVTHDPMLALLADRRVIMKNGGMFRLHTTTPEERLLLQKLEQINKEITFLRDQLRKGCTVSEDCLQGLEVKDWQLNNDSIAETLL
jgi:ABC-type lipoprotein export system ATPase subunit